MRAPYHRRPRRAPRSSHVSSVHHREPGLGELLGQVAVGVEQREQPRRLAVGDQHRGDRQPGAVERALARPRRPQRHGAAQPAPQLPHGVPLGLEEGVLGVDGHLSEPRRRSTTRDRRDGSDRHPHDSRTRPIPVNKNVPMLTPAPEPAEPTARRRSGEVACAAGACSSSAFALFALTARHGDGSWDYYTANYASWHLVHDRSPMARRPDRSPGSTATPRPGSGSWRPTTATSISRFPGVIAIALPAYWIAHVSVGRRDDRRSRSAHRCRWLPPWRLMLMFLALRTRVSDRTCCRGCGRPGLRHAGLDRSPRTPCGRTPSRCSASRAWPGAAANQTLVGSSGCSAASPSGAGCTLRSIVALLGVRPGLAPRRNLSITLVIGVDQRGLPRLCSCVWTKWMDRLVEPDRLLRHDVFDVGRRPARDGSPASSGMLGLLRPWHPRVDPDPGAADACRRPGLERPARLGPRPCWSAAWSTPWSRPCSSPAPRGDSFYGYRLGIEFVVARPRPTR